MEQLLARPQWNRFGEGMQTTRSQGEVRFQETLKLDPGLFVEHDEIDIVETGGGFPQAIGQGIVRKCCVVLSPGETLFLRCCDNSAIFQQGGGAVMVVSGYSEYSHSSHRLLSEQRVNEWRYGRTLG